MTSTPPHMDLVQQRLEESGWPSGIGKTFLESNEHIGLRFIIIDNSRSMLKRDAHRLIGGRVDDPKMEVCSRWEQVTSSILSLISLADAAEAPTEVRLLNKAEPVMVGLGISEKNMEEITTLLAIEPCGLTPLCKQLQGVIDTVRDMEQQLHDSGKKAWLLIITDGESTDGNVAEMLKPLQGLPLQILIRMCTEEIEVCDYWENINASLDLDIRILNDVMVEAQRCMESNPWLTYGAPIHHAREFGMMLNVPALDVLKDRSLTKGEIKTLAKILLSREDYGGVLPDPEVNWELFVQGVISLQQQVPLVYCPLKKVMRPWFNAYELRKYEVDEDLDMDEPSSSSLWNIYLFYSYNASLLSSETVLHERMIMQQDRSMYGITPRKNKYKMMPSFDTCPVSRQDKRLLHQDDLWQLVNDFGMFICEKITLTLLYRNPCASK